MLYDVAIIGGGPAGLTAAIYATRANLKTVVFEKAICGGQIVNTPQIDNYPGLPHVSGFDFSKKLEDQAKELGAEIKNEEVTAFRKEENFTIVADEEYQARSIVLATGVAPRHLEIPGEKELLGRGISFCSTCDGGFFAGKDVVVIGGGDTALQDAKYLANICRKVYLVHRRGEFRGKASNVEKVQALENVEFVLNAMPERVLGENKVEGLVVKQSGEERVLEVSGIFEAVGRAAQGSTLNPGLITDEQGYLIADANLQSSVPGVFLAGDLRQKRTRQLTTAVADGAEVIASVAEYLK